MRDTAIAWTLFVVGVGAWVYVMAFLAREYERQKNRESGDD